MKVPAVLLLVLGIALARGDATPDKVNQLETKNVLQFFSVTDKKVAKPPGLETAGTITADVHAPHLQYHASRLDNQDMKFQQHSQLQNSQSHVQNQASQFYNQNQASQIHSMDMNRQFQGQNEAQFHNQGPAQQLRHQSQMVSGSPDQARAQQIQHQSQFASASPVHDAGRDVSSLVQSQQRMSPAAVSTIQSHSNEQIHDYAAQQHYSGEGHPEQEFYHDRRNMVDVQGRMDEQRFDDASRQQNQIISGIQSTEIRSGGFPTQVFHQRSVYGNAPQPVALPGVRQTHSTSVVVSGLKTLPVLPGLVYSASPVPAAHAVAYGRPLFQGGAYLKQHWQTPYARYVYSHIL